MAFNFGFKLAPSSAINLDTVDKTVFNELYKLEPDARICMACGSCTATCTAGPFTGMSIRKVLLDLQRGKTPEVQKMLSGCMLCGKCSMVCPRGINTRHLVLSLCRVYKTDSGEGMSK